MDELLACQACGTTWPARILDNSGRCPQCALDQVPLTCGHWDMEANARCGRPATSRVVCSGDGETWAGPLCSAHLDEYLDDEELDVTEVTSLGQRCECPKVAVEHSAGLCLKTATRTVRRGQVDPQVLHLCVDCTLPGDVALDRSDEWS